MRYVLQILVMLGDLLLLAMIAMVLMFSFQSPIAWLLVIVAVRVWWREGGFEAWRPSTIKRFLSNARKYGL